MSTVLKLLDNKNYKIVNDILLTCKDNKTTQIDHVIISIYGIFVIETKNYKGWIIGNEKDKYWKQVIYKTKNSFYNPIRQNYAHEQAIKSLFNETPQLKIIPIVVFSNNSTLKVITSKDVVYTANLVKTIRKYKKECFSEEQILEFYNRLQNINSTEKNAKSEHVKYIKEKVKDYKNKCPKCNGELKKRAGKYGFFYGCTNYPKCKYTKNI